MASFQYCNDSIVQEQIRFNSIVYVSLGLTAVSFFCSLCAKEWMLSNPGKTSKFYYGLGAVKILVGILLFTVFSPGCPSECEQYCTTYHPSYAYPIIVLVIGALWLRRGHKFAALEAAGGGSTAVAMPVSAAAPEGAGMVSTKSNDVV